MCTNGTDDDLDGLTDCLDDDCDGLCPENCGDGRDNDADGAIDCDDRDCFGSCPEVCGDGFDNDGDGKVDCLDEECVDPSCAEICTDGRDNDADALVDCADDDCNDPSCDEACADGRDNDADGRVDCDDSDCDGDCPEICDDGRDNDADGRIDCDDDECEAVCDVDGDGFFGEAFGGDDCDDTRADVNPDRPEICNGDEVLDDDCDGLFDEEDPDVDVFTLIAWGPDVDGDGFGTDVDVMFACQQPDGWGFANRDCDDTRDYVNPDMPEICNPEGPLDDDCDGLVDDADPDVTEDSYLEWFADRDGDGFGAEDDFEYACSRPDGTSATNDDCDDADPTVGPPSLWYPDGDRDGFGAGEPVDPTPTCDPPGPGVRPEWVGLDCDDGDPGTYPGAEEICEDGIDQDCDGEDRTCIIAVWEEVHEAGVTPRAQCDSWNVFRTLLPAFGVEEITMYGDFDPSGITCAEPIPAQGLANAIRDGTDWEGDCSGHFWSICARYSGELWVDAPFLCDGSNCPSPGYITRPCIGNANWGGVNTATCGGPTQMMGVRVR
ncbi:MAG: hypothetical protein ACI9K2_006478 [Myxococcota bacterium]